MSKKIKLKEMNDDVNISSSKIYTYCIDDSHCRCVFNVDLS